MDKTGRVFGTVIRVVVYVATLVALCMLTLSCIYDGPYYRYIFGTIRYYQLPFIFLFAVVVLLIAWFVFKGRRALIRFLSLVLLLVYACTLLCISEVYLHNKTDMTKDEIVMHYGYREEDFVSDNDLKMKYANVKELSPKAFKKIDCIEYIFLPDNFEFGKAVIVKNKPLIKDNEINEFAWEKARADSCHSTNIYILLHKKSAPNTVKVVRGDFVAFKNELVNRIFARGDNSHYFQDFSSMTLFYLVAILIALSWLESKESFKEKVSRTLDKVVEIFVGDEE